MIKGGYVLQPRKLDKSPVMRMPPCTREVWTYILRRVNHKDNGELSRGEGFFNFEEIQEDLCWYVGYTKKKYSKSQLSKAFKKLAKAEMIETKKSTRGIIIRVNKYEYYQNPRNYEGHTEKPPEEKEDVQYSKEVETIYDFALSYFPENLHPNTKKRRENWKETIDKLMRIDKQDKKEICRVIKWARLNDFWKKNFLSLNKLRQTSKDDVKYYEIFRNQMKDSKEDIPSSNPNLKKL